MKNSNRKLIKGKIIGDSPIKQHIKEVDKKLKQKYLSKKPLKKEIDEATLQKQYQRMKFMGIPTNQKDESEDTKESSHKYDDDDKLTLKDKQSEREIVPEAVKLLPKIPSLRCVIDECKDVRRDKKVFKKAQPRGNDPKMLRTDKSLPWMENELKEARKRKVKETGKSNSIEIITFDQHDSVEGVGKFRKYDENWSDLRKSYSKMIADKFELHKVRDINDNENVESEKKSITLSTISSLSSAGTNFTNDSGSYFQILDQKIPKSHVNVEKKFQVHKLIIFFSY